MLYGTRVAVSKVYSLLPNITSLSRRYKNIPLLQGGYARLLASDTLCVCESLLFRGIINFR